MLSRAFPVVSLAHLFLQIGPVVAAGQVPIHSVADPVCETCRVMIVPVATLGASDGMGMLEASHNNLTRDREGHYYVWTPASPYFWIFDDEGVIDSRIGRRGEGPGEFSHIASVVIDPADSVFVYDLQQRRVSVFSPDHELARTFGLTFTDGAPAFFVDDRMLARGAIRTPERIGYPLHIVDKRGQIVRSFGSDTPLWRPDLREILDIRIVAPGPDASVWAGWLNQYLIEDWDTAGRMVRAIRREVDWFEPWWSTEGASIDAPPAPVMTGLQIRGDTLWVLVQIADEDWRNAVQPHGDTYRIVSRDGYKDTMIEAIDLRTMRVIVTGRLSTALSGFAGPGLVYGRGADSGGNPVVHVSELRIVQSPAGTRREQ